MSSTQLEKLAKYTACDISDALQQLGMSRGGFIPDVIPRGNSLKKSKTALVGRASTVLFTVAGENLSNRGPRNVPEDKHWVDCVEKDTIIVMSQPEGQHNGVLGGITALRLQILSISGIVVHGRVRDIEEIQDLDLPVWSKGISTVGPDSLTVAHSINIPLDIQGVTITPGDIVFADLNGVVIIPQSILDEVVELLPILGTGDKEAMEAVKDGMSVTEAFQMYRKRT